MPVQKVPRSMSVPMIPDRKYYTHRFRQWNRFCVIANARSRACSTISAGRREVQHNTYLSQRVHAAPLLQSIRSNKAPWSVSCMSRVAQKWKPINKTNQTTRRSHVVKPLGSMLKLSRGCTCRTRFCQTMCSCCDIFLDCRYRRSKCCHSGQLESFEVVIQLLVERLSVKIQPARIVQRLSWLAGDVRACHHNILAKAQQHLEIRSKIN